MCVSELECGVAKSVSERPLNRNVLSLVPSVTYIYAFVVIGLPILVALLLDARILTLCLDRTVFVFERNGERHLARWVDATCKHVCQCIS